jgi:hypothetical protein
MTKKPVELATDRLGKDAGKFYQAFLDAHEELTFEQSVRLNARLALILANQIGDIDVVMTALKSARKEAKRS